MKPSTAKGISTFLKVLAVLTFIGGFILGIILGKNLKGDFDFAAALVYWARGLIYGMIVLAISAIIDLLLRIINKLFGNNGGEVERITHSRDEDDDQIRRRQARKLQSGSFL